MSIKLDRLLSFLLILALVSYVLFTAYRYLYSPYQTMVTYEHVESEIYNANAVILRDEVVLNDNASTNCYYLVDDADIVEQGQQVAVEYPSIDDIHKREQIKRYEDEIKGLQNAVALKDSFLATDMINLQIGQVISQIGKSATGTNAKDIEKLSQNLTELLNKKQVTTGRDSGLESRISYLSSQKNYLSSQISSSLRNVHSSHWGYFVGKADGYENLLSAKNRENIPISQYKSFIKKEVSVSNPSNIGKIITDHNWYVAFVVPQYQTDKFSVNDRVKLNFGISVQTDVEGVISNVITEENGDEVVVIIKSNYVVPELVYLRHVNVEVQFKQYAGLRIDSESLRYNQENQSGVYVIEGNRITFKSIDIIKQSDTYVLCDPNSQIKNSLALFDEVIVKGIDMYDGKIITKFH